MKSFYRPIPTSGPASADSALRLADGWCRFTRVERLERGAAPRIMPADEVPADILARLTAPRAPLAGVPLDRPALMGIVNVTPDSFSDGGAHDGAEAAIAHARSLADAGAAILDIGGESTRPGAVEVPEEEEIARVVPVIEGLRAGGVDTAISIDTRKAGVGRAALAAGADIVNDVSAFRFDPDLAVVAAEADAPVILMHSLAEPGTMQDDPRYDDVLLDVYEALDRAVSDAEAAGIPRSRIVVDPGIGFGKTQAHNLALLGRLSLFHGLGCAVLLGVSRKGFIGRITNVSDPAARDTGSAAVGLWALSQGIQVLRVHDMTIHGQGLALWQAMGAIPHEENGQ
ncbi:dihydropteroate synthase [Rhodobacterales bacterium HKCCE2091]|nr:dihydropteroate synthase [Rhodobacterales bacterium HKCCE2091]